MKLALYCKCGAVARGIVEPAAKAEQFRKWWEQMHRMAACGPATPHEAAKTRQKAENAVRRP